LRVLRGVLGVVGPFGDLLLKPGYFLVEVGACQFVVEVESHIRQFLEGVQEAFVEAGAVDCSDVLYQSSKKSRQNVGTLTRPCASYS